MYLKMVMKNSTGSSGMQSTTAGSYDELKTVVTVAAMKKETNQDAMTMPLTTSVEKMGYLPNGRQEASTRSILSIANMMMCCSLEIAIIKLITSFFYVDIESFFGTLVPIFYSGSSLVD
jgi:hypothetical protein